VIDQRITVSLNGKPRELSAGLNIEALIEELSIDRRLVAIAVNSEVVPRDAYAAVTLREGDAVEIVRMVGGG
jgi:thiamine biosynthesis protein ThiS